MQNEPTTTAQQPTYDYIGEQVQIGTGFGGMKPVAQHGVVAIGQQTLVLFNDNGQLIDQAPLSSVTVKSLWYTMGGTAMVTFEGRHYSVAIGHGQFLAAPTAALGATTAQTKGFITAFNQLSGK